MLLQAVADIELVTAPASVIRYNNLRSVTLNGGPAPGYSSGQAIAAMEALAKRTLPNGYGYEWTGTALQEKAASGQTGFILALAVVFAYLFLVGLYESTAIPVAALLSVAVGLFGALAALFVSGLVWAGATVLTSMAWDFYSLFFARVLMGFGVGATLPTATRAMQHWVESKKRGYAQGITHAFSRLGNALTPALIVTLAS